MEFVWDLGFGAWVLVCTSGANPPCPITGLLYLDHVVKAYCRVAVVWIVAGALSFEALTARAAARPESATRRSVKPVQPDFAKDVKPLLSEYCYGCHGEKKKGGLDFRIYTDDKTTLHDRQVFEKVLAKLQAHEMPPENKPQPTAAECQLITNWVTSCFFKCDCNHPDPGRITIRRLNRAEYNNTIRDLMGIDFQPAGDFPADDSGYGFDNIGDVLSLSPVLMEKYLGAAEKIVIAAFGDSDSTNRTAPSALAHTNAAYQRIMICEPGEGPALVCARKIITSFATRAFRRPITAQEQERLLSLFDAMAARGDSFDTAIKLVVEAVLVSPQFLFRGDVQTEPNNPKAIHPVDEYALASRLSYFLWSSMPDEKLFAQAARRSLRRNLESEITRMLKEPKARALVENFAGQWLQLRNLKLVSPAQKKFPLFDESLRAAMEQETDLFFESICRENRSLMDFIGADYTFLNGKLAHLYGIDGVEGDQFRRVTLKGNQRGGLLTQASILTITSNPTRTSPVKRGKWVLENILGAPPPPPPPNVPELKEGKEALTGPLRHRMEQHRSDPNCSTCHARMDPIGFGFENFDAIGAWREREGDFDIDASGKLQTGESFNGPAELKALLLKEKRDDFIRCLTEKMLTYALGRGLEYCDKCAVERITKNLAKDHYKFSTLILEVVKSAPFQMRRGETPPAEAIASNEGSGK